VRGNLSFTTGSAEGHEGRGNSKLGRRQNPKMQGAGQLAASSGGATGRRSREVSAPDVPKDERIGATRNSIAGTAFEMRCPGRPGD